MTNTQIIDVELSRPGWQANIFAVAGDMYSRYIEVHLYNGGQPYEPPSGTTCMIGWWRNDTEFGSYNSVMTDDHSTRQAWSIDGNVVTIELNWQIAQKAGKVGVNVALIGTDGSRISTWEMLCDVQRGPVADADDPTKPSESATDAANRAEAAAAEAQDSAADLADAVKRAEEAAQRAESLAPTEGLVNSVNGKGGVVVLDAYDVGALPSPATTAGVEAGMFLTVKEVTAEGKIITEAVEPPNDAGFVEITENIPAEQRKAGVLYGLVVMDLSAETEPATFNN